MNLEQAIARETQETAHLGPAPLCERCEDPMTLACRIEGKPRRYVHRRTCADCKRKLCYVCLPQSYPVPLCYDCREKIEPDARRVDWETGEAFGS